MGASPASAANPPPVSGHDRLAALDGLRGLAIVLVMLYHYLSRWADLYPFGGTFAEFPLFRYGYVGVELFFLISGFVILMTLKRTATLSEFLLKRWLRLFPAMAIATVAIMLTADLLLGRPAGQPTLLSVLPGLTFIDPEHWALLGVTIHPLEGAFWSLFVEVKFYVIAGLVYFWRGTRALLITMALISVATKLLPAGAGLVLGDSAKATMGFVLGESLAGIYMPLFLVGAVVFERQRLSRREIFLFLVSALVPLALHYRHSVADIALIAIIVPLFWATITWRRLADAVSNRFLLFFGYVSYPLYLVHENAGVALIKIEDREFGPGLPAALLMALAGAVVTLVAWLIAKWGEPALRRALVKLLLKPAPVPSS